MELAFLLVSLLAAPPNTAKPAAPSLYERLLPSTVSITATRTESGTRVSGSGVILRSDGTILTNYHVVQGSETFEVRFSGGESPVSISARPSGCAPEYDLATIKLLAVPMPLKPVRTVSALPSVGDRVFAIGAPLELTGSFSDGVISQLRQLGERTLLQTTAPISPGSSGGGLFRADGALVGITTMTMPDGQALNFAVPAQSFSSIRPCSDFPEVKVVQATPEPTPTPKPPDPCPSLVEVMKMTSAFLASDEAGMKRYVQELDERRAGGRHLPTPNSSFVIALGQLRSLRDAFHSGRFDAIRPSTVESLTVSLDDYVPRYSAMIDAISNAYYNPNSMAAVTAVVPAIGPAVASRTTFLGSAQFVQDDAQRLCSGNGR